MADEPPDEPLEDPLLADADSDFFAGAALVSVFVDESDEPLDSVELSLDELVAAAAVDDELPDDDPPVRLSFL